MSKNYTVSNRFRISTINDECVVIKGKKATRIFLEEKESCVPYILIESFSNNYVKFTDDLKCPQCQADDILMVMDGASSGLVATGLKGAIGSTLAAIKIKNKNILFHKFLFYYLKSKFSLFNNTTSGSAIPHVDKNLLTNLSIPIPPMEIQKKIVAILERADEIKRKREQANQLTNKILQSVFLKMFGMEKYPTDHIENHVHKTEIRDPRKKPNEVFQYVDISGVDNTIGRIKETKTILGRDAPSRARRIIRKKDVIVSTVRPNLNATAIVPPELDEQICSTGFCVLRCRETLNPIYLYACTRRKQFITYLSSKMKGASYPAVTNEDVLNFMIPIPPIELQNEFASIVVTFDAIRERQKESTSEINKLFHSLMHRAFKGELVN